MLFHLEYAAEVWSPHTAKDKIFFDSVQKCALRMSTRNYNLRYDELLDICKIPSLENRRHYLSLCRFYCIINGLIYFPSHLLPHPCTSRSTHSVLLNVPYARTNSQQHSFIHQSISLWNCLPAESVTATSFSLFKYYTLPLFM